MTLVEVYEAAQGKITGAQPWAWVCWGPMAHLMDIDQGRARCVFDRQSGQVYCLEVFDPEGTQAWRWIDPTEADKYYEECRANNVNFDQAWEGVDFRDVDPLAILLTLNSLVPQDPIQEPQPRDIT